jgi:hypothetical protein
MHCRTVMDPTTAAAVASCPTVVIFRGSRGRTLGTGVFIPGFMVRPKTNTRTDTTFYGFLCMQTSTYTLIIPVSLAAGAHMREPTCREIHHGFRHLYVCLDRYACDVRNICSAYERLRRGRILQQPLHVFLDTRVVALQ